jgi:hypothetical protein
MDKQQEIINKLNNSQNQISPISKMKIINAEKLKRESQYWIDHFKYKQSLINQLEIIKNEKPEKNQKITQISSFSNEQEILCDNLYKLNQITNFSQLKLGKNYDKMKIIENNEETQKKKLNEIFEKNLEKIKDIEKTSEEIDVQRQLLNSWYENVEKMKTNISAVRKEDCINIDSLCNKYIQEDKEFKKITKLYNLLCNITKYRVLNIQNDENNSKAQIVKGYLLNAKNGNILSYNITIKNNESVENKAIKVFNFWKTLIDFNKND